MSTPADSPVTSLSETQLATEVLRSCGPHGGVAGVPRLACEVVRDLLKVLAVTRRVWLVEALQDRTAATGTSGTSPDEERAPLWRVVLRATNDRTAEAPLRALATIAALALRAEAGESDAAIGHLEHIRIMDLGGALPALGARLYELVRLARQPLAERHLETLGAELIDLLDQLEAIVPISSLVPVEQRPISPDELTKVFRDTPDDRLLTSREVQQMFRWSKTTFERQKKVFRHLVKPIPGRGKSLLWPALALLKWGQRKGKEVSWRDLPEDLQTKLTYILGHHRIARPRLSKDAAISQGLHVG